MYYKYVCCVVVICHLKSSCFLFDYEEHFSGRQSYKCDHVTNVNIFYFKLTCNVIGDPEVSTNDV